MVSYIKNYDKNKGTPEEIAQQLAMELRLENWGLLFVNSKKMILAGL